jgi:hypothetical protein
MRIQKTLRNFLFDALGKTYFRWPFLLKISGKKYFGLNKIDRELARIIPEFNGFYVDLGANDGNSQSNTKYFENSRNWHGLLIEPVPALYKKLIRNRSKRNFFKNCACVSVGGPNHVTVLYSGLMSTTLGDRTMHEKNYSHARSGEEHLSGNDEIQEIEVLAYPLGQLLIEINAPSIMDFLSLDVEGFELEVLKGVNHDNYRFRFILVETDELDILSNFLRHVDYKFLQQLSHHDYLFANSR